MAHDRPLGTSGPGTDPVKIVKIPNTCTCIWCGGTMERRGSTILGAPPCCVSLFCTRCNGVTVHINPGVKKIHRIEHNIQYEGHRCRRRR